MGQTFKLLLLLVASSAHGQMTLQELKDEIDTVDIPVILNHLESRQGEYITAEGRYWQGQCHFTFDTFPSHTDAALDLRSPTNLDGVAEVAGDSWNTFLRGQAKQYVSRYEKAALCANVYQHTNGWGYWLNFAFRWNGVLWDRGVHVQGPDVHSGIDFPWRSEIPPE